MTTVHDMCAYFAASQKTKLRVPDNCSPHNVRDYLASRFNCHTEPLQAMPNILVKKCPTCGR
jgi:phage gp36-like protein